MSVLVKETRPPRLRTASMLFGVVVVSSSAAAATHFALRDRQGDAACGNIGQRGSTTTIIEMRTAPADAIAHVVDDPLRRVDPPSDIARPLVDRDGDPAPGNAMTKSPPRSQ
jgi:hypothetical protein